MKMPRLFYIVCSFLLIGLLLGLRVPAQTETATISGLITDETGAVVPGAEVKLQSVERGAVSTTTTNNAGIYVFPSVQPGQYQIRVDKAGFKQVDFLGLIVNVQDHIEQNFRMQIGSVSESVTVSASDLHINTQDATVSTVVDRQFAENLPLNGRSFQTLINLTPGVVVVPSNSADSGQFSVNGQRAASNYTTVDGVSANVGVSTGAGPGFSGNGVGGTLGTFGVQGGTNSLVSVDALQEFRIQTSTYAPEFGRTPGAQISIVTRSGANQFHGTAFDYLRNDLFDANDWFANSKGLRKPPERQNDFGGTFSGPIRKDRTFFFFSYEGLRLRLPRVGLTTVPDDASVAGGLNARGNAIPAMLPFLNAFPLPNGPEVLDAKGNPTGAAQFNGSFSNKSTLDAYSLRIDHKLGDKLNLFGRYNYSPSEIVARGSATSTTLSLSELQPARITVQTGTIGATWLVSATVTNDLRFNYSRTNAESSSFLDNFGGAVPLPSLPLPSPLTSQDATFGLNILNRAFLSVGTNAHNIQRQTNVVDSLSTQKGRHSLKFGVDFRRMAPEVNPALYTQTAFFASVPSAETGTSNFGAITSNALVTLAFYNLGAFAQDTWRVNSRFSLTYGLRWDLDFAPASLDGPSIPAVTGFDLNDFSKLEFAPAGTPPFKTTYGNVAPRIGLAYQLAERQDWGTVLRGGFGVFYDLASSETWGAVTSRPPFSSGQIHFFGEPFPYKDAVIAPPSIPSTGVLSPITAFNPNLKLPYTFEWNFAMEQALGKEQSISASYLGASGRRLLQTTSVSSPSTNPVVNGNFVDNTATSDYHALQIQFQRRLSRGLQVLTSYTWSHSIDSASAGSLGVVSNLFIPSSTGNGNRSSSDFDIRHAFSAGVTYIVPSPKSNAFAKEIFGGWSLDNIVLVRSAPPVDISDGNFFEFTSGLFADVRPDLVNGKPLYLYGPQYPGGKAFNANAFTDPPTDPSTGFTPLRQGNVPRNFLRGYGATQWDFAVHREFPIHESLTLQFRAELFNVLNHPNFGQPSGCFGGFCANPFGQSTEMLGQFLNGGTVGSNLGGGAFDPLYQLGGPRSIQFALKLTF